MEMIKGYESDSASSEASETQEHTGTEMPEVNRQEINARAVAISKIGNGESRNGERGTGNGERGISKIGNI